MELGAIELYPVGRLPPKKKSQFKFNLNEVFEIKLMIKYRIRLQMERLEQLEEPMLRS